MEDRKAKVRFCLEHYDTPDAEFHEEAKRKGWLADPLVQELFRRLGKAPGEWEAQTAEHLRGAAEWQYRTRRLQVSEQNKARLAEDLAVEEAVSPIVANRKGPKSKYLVFIVNVIRSHGALPKGSLVEACVRKWPDKRVAISNCINRELKRKDRLLKEQPHNKFIAIRWH